MEQLYDTNYSIATHWLDSQLILCNDIALVDPTVKKNARFPWVNVVEWEDSNGDVREGEEEVPIAQYYLTNCTESDIQYLEGAFPGIKFSYSEMLDLFVLCVPYFGEHWKMIGFKTTNPRAKAKLGQTKEDIIKI